MAIFVGVIQTFFRTTSATTHQISIPTSQIKLMIRLETMNLSHDLIWLGLHSTNMHTWMLPDQTISLSTEDTLINVDLVKDVAALQIPVSNKFFQEQIACLIPNISMVHTKLLDENKGSHCHPMMTSNDAIEWFCTRMLPWTWKWPFYCFIYFLNLV